AGARHRGFIHAPDAGDVLAVVRIADVAQPGELIALLPVLATALAVGLADNRAVAAVRLPDSARRQDEVDGAEAVLHAVRMVFDATGVKQKARARRAPP